MLLGYTNTEFEDVIYECGDGNVFVFLAVSLEHIFKIWVELISGKVKFLILEI